MPFQKVINRDTFQSCVRPVEFVVDPIHRNTICTGLGFTITKVPSRSVDPQKNHHNYVITCSILTFLTPWRSSLQRRSFDIYVSAVGSKNKKLAILP